MKYEKPALTLDEQVDLLAERGMLGDPDLIRQRLSTVNYYRLSGYWYPFRNPDDTFKPGTHFDKVWHFYVFDRRLRLLVMDAIERIEIAVRTQLAYHHAQEHGPFAYANDPASLPKLGIAEYADFLAGVRKETDRSKERFVGHFTRKYGDSHDFLPVWMATEVMTFGTILSFYRNSAHRVKQSVASMVQMPHKVFDSWLHTLNTIRNICAHHGRLWNRKLGVKPIMPDAQRHPDWHRPVLVENDRVFGVLTICRYGLRLIAPQSHWPMRLTALLADYPDVPIHWMGFPRNWRSCPVWRDS